MTQLAPPSPWRKPLLSVTEAGALMGLSRPTIYRAVKAGKIPTVTFDGVQRVRTTDLMELLGLPVPAEDDPRYCGEGHFKCGEDH